MMRNVFLFLFMIIGFALGAGRPHYVAKYTVPDSEVVISNFDGGAGTEWTKSSGGDSIADDNVYVQNGSKSIRIYSTGTNTAMQRTLSPVLDLSGVDAINFNIHINANYKAHYDSTAELWLQIIFSSSGTALSSYYNFTSQLHKIYKADNWYRLSLPKKFFAKAGATATPNWSAINLIKLRHVASTGYSSFITFDQLKAIKCPNEKAGMLFYIDGSDSNFYILGKPYFDKYNLKASYFVHMNMGADSVKIINQYLTMQTQGYDICTYGFTGERYDTLSNVKIDSNMAIAKTWMISHGFKGAPLWGVPQGSRNRLVDSIANFYYDYSRMAGNYLSWNNCIYASILAIPTYDAKHMAPNYIFLNTDPFSYAMKAIDSAIVNRSVGGILLHNFGSDASSIDTLKLDTLLNHVRNQIDSGNLSTESGRWTNYMLYAPDSLITKKLIETTTDGYVLTCSLSTIADSAKIYLHEYSSNEGAGDILVDSTILLVNGSIFIFNESGKTNNAKYYFRIFALNNSGAIDSAHTMDSLIVRQSNGSGLGNSLSPVFRLSL